MYKIIVNLFYDPVAELITYLQQNSDICVPINGGSSLSKNVCPINIILDNSGDNISSKNSVLNELTSIYWFWKNYNLTDLSHVGFNHYRRFFDRHDLSDYADYDLIVAKPIRCPYTLVWQYNYYHKIEDLQICANTLKTMFPDFQSRFVDYINTKTDNFAPCNMFLMRKDLFNEWCEFIFAVVLELEKRIDLSGRDNYQKRALCFLTERLFGFWCYDKMMSGVRVKQIDMIEHKEYKNNKLNERGTY